MDEHLVLTQQKLIIGGELSDLLQVGLCLIQPKLISLRVKLSANVFSQLLELAQAKLFLLPIQLQKGMLVLKIRTGLAIFTQIESEA